MSGADLVLAALGDPLQLAQRVLRNPTLGPLFARVASRRVFVSRLRRLFGRADAVDEAELDLLWEALIRGEGRAALPRISRYLDAIWNLWNWGDVAARLRNAQSLDLGLIDTALDPAAPLIADDEPRAPEHP